MNDLSSSRNRPSTSEHRRSDGSLPIRNAQRSPGELHEIEQQHEAEVNQLLQIIRNQQTQIQQLQEQLSQSSETTTVNISETDNISQCKGETAKLSQENQMPCQSVPDLETPKPLRPITVEDPFPWDFQPEWPVARARRIDELKRIAPFYNGSHQTANIAAAIDWHAQFDPDEIVPADLVIFQRGKKVDKSDVRQGEAPWEEGCDDDFVNGDDYT